MRAKKPVPVECRGDGAARITLYSKGEAFTVLIDTEDLQRVLEHTWYILHRPHTKYAATTIRLPDGSQTTRLLHRFLTNAPDGLDVDHWRTFDGLDNRQLNLRVVSTQKNIFNRRGLGANNTSGYRGVSWHKGTGKFEARVEVAGQACYLGLYLTAEEAGQVAAAFRKELERLNITAGPEALQLAKEFRKKYRESKLPKAA